MRWAGWVGQQHAYEVVQFVGQLVGIGGWRFGGTRCEWEGAAETVHKDGSRQVDAKPWVGTWPYQAMLHAEWSQNTDRCVHCLTPAFPALLPPLPPDLSRPLPVPPGGHAWEALQAAANDNVRHFDAAAAKMGWKKWALTKAHSGGAGRGGVALGVAGPPGSSGGGRGGRAIGVEWGGVGHRTRT